jgi:hypothetical protein
MKRTSAVLLRSGAPKKVANSRPVGRWLTRSCERGARKSSSPRGVLPGGRASPVSAIAKNSVYFAKQTHAFSVSGFDAERFARRVVRIFGQSNVGTKSRYPESTSQAATGGSNAARESWVPVTEKEAAAVSSGTIADIANE